MTRSLPIGPVRKALGMLLVLGLPLLWLIGAVAPATATSGGSRASQALPDYLACLKAQHQGDLLLLIDSSSSLQQTDPANDRVVAARLLLARLAGDTARGGVTLDVAVAGFDASLTQSTSWTGLSQQSLPAMQQAVADYAKRNQGFETDYWSALTKARSILAARRPGADPSQRCQAMLLFTDGQYVLSPRTSAADIARYGASKPIPGVSTVRIDSQAAADRVAAAGQQDLCRAGGVADQLRVDGITTVAVGLASTASSGVQDFSLLSRLAENADGSCGRQPGLGLFLPATNVNDLVLIFDRIGSFGGTTVLPPLGVCETYPCPSSAHTFDLDSSIGRIHLLGVANVSPIEIRLRLPGYPAVALRYTGSPVRFAVGTTALTVTWYSDEVVSIDATAGSPKAWAGRWSLTFVDFTGANPAGISRVQLSISGDLAGQLATSGLTASEPADLRLDLVREDGSAADLGTVRPTITADVAARAGQRDVQIAEGVPVTGTETPVDWNVPADFPVGEAALIVVLHVRTLTGLQLADQTRETNVQVRPAPGTPAIDSTRISFGLLQGTATGHARISVTGAGCVWLKSSEPTVFPAGADGATVGSSYTSAAHCLAGHDGGAVALPITLIHSRPANGQLQGTVVLAAAPAGRPDRASEVTVSYTASLERLPNHSVEWLVFLCCMIVGLGLPLALLCYLRYRGARLPAGAVQKVLVGATVDGTQVRITGADPAEASNWTSSGQVDETRRSLLLGSAGSIDPSSGLTVRARAGLRLDQPGYAVLEVAPGYAGCGSAPPHATKSGQPILPLELTGGWAFFAADPPADGPISGQLLLIAPQLASAADLGHVAARALGDVGRVVNQCRSGWPAQPGPDAGGPAPNDLSPATSPAAGPVWGPGLDPDDPIS